MSDNKQKGGNIGYNINSQNPISCGIETVGNYNQCSKPTGMPESSLLIEPVPIDVNENNVLKGGRGYGFNVSKPLTNDVCVGNVAEVVPTAENCKPMVDTKPTPLPLDISTNAQTQSSQSGGSDKIYNYIIDPETLEKLSIYSNKGKALIKKMVKLVRDSK